MKIAVWIVAGMLGLALVIAAVPSDSEIEHTEAEELCEYEDIEYSELQYESSRIPDGYDYHIQEGELGERYACIDEDEEVASEEVTREPVDDIGVRGSGDLPLDADFWYDDQDVVESWIIEHEEFDRDFVEEAIEEYCEEYYDDYYCE